MRVHIQTLSSSALLALWLSLLLLLLLGVIRPTAMVEASTATVVTVHDLPLFSSYSYVRNTFYALHTIHCRRETRSVHAHFLTLPMHVWRENKRV